VEVVLTKASDPVQIIEQLCGGAEADPSLMLVSQLELYSLLLRRYAQDTVMLVDESAEASSANTKRGRESPLFWSPYVPHAWEFASKQSSRVADMIYTYARRTYLAPLNVPPPSCGSGLSDRYRYRPVEIKEAPEQKQEEVVVVLNGDDAVRHA